MRIKNYITSILLASTLVLSSSANAEEAKTLLNVSYDVSRELYNEINPAFVKYWKDSKGSDVTVNQSHGGSSKQALAVISGLEADVVTMNQAPDIDSIADKGLANKEWRKQFPNEASPYTTTTVFLVRKGSPKNIKDWDDLAKADIQVIRPLAKVKSFVLE